STCCRLPHHGDHVLARAIHEKLKLTVLIDWAETGDRRRALAILAQALGPQLDVPMGEAADAVGIRYHHADANAFLISERDVHRCTHSWREVSGTGSRPHSRDDLGGAGPERPHIQSAGNRRQEAYVG